MTDMTAGLTRRRAARPTAEYRAYYALILALALPVNAALWPLSLAGIGPRQPGGPIRAAREQANTVTPKLFWG